MIKKNDARRLAVAFPEHLLLMFNQTMSAKLKAADAKQMTDEGKTFKVNVKEGIAQGKWIVRSYKSMPARCVNAVRAFVKKMDNRFVLVAIIGGYGNAENIVGQFTPILFKAEEPDLDEDGALVEAGIWTSYPGLIV